VRDKTPSVVVPLYAEIVDLVGYPTSRSPFLSVAGVASKVAGASEGQDHEEVKVQEGQIIQFGTKYVLLA
jgi:hypothetical protein